MKGVDCTNVSLMDGWGCIRREDKDHHLMGNVGSVFKILLLSMLHGNISHASLLGQVYGSLREVAEPPPLNCLINPHQCSLSFPIKIE